MSCRYDGGRFLDWRRFLYLVAEEVEKFRVVVLIDMVHIPQSEFADFLARTMMASQSFERASTVSRW